MSEEGFEKKKFFFLRFSFYLFLYSITNYIYIAFGGFNKNKKSEDKNVHLLLLCDKLYVFYIIICGLYVHEKYYIDRYVNSRQYVNLKKKKD